MNSLHTIKLQNDIAAVRGKVLSFNRANKQLLLAGQPIGPTFLSRAHANSWAAKYGASVAVV